MCVAFGFFSVILSFLVVFCLHTRLEDVRPVRVRSTACRTGVLLLGIPERALAVLIALESKRSEDTMEPFTFQGTQSVQHAKRIMERELPQ